MLGASPPEDAMREAVVETRGLRQEFHTRRARQVVAARDLDPAVPAGGVHGFWGPNGCPEHCNQMASLKPRGGFGLPRRGRPRPGHGVAAVVAPVRRPLTRMGQASGVQWQT
jgi:hypothetical protein